MFALGGVSQLEFYRELKYGLYFKLKNGDHYFVSKEIIGNTDSQLQCPLVFCEDTSAIQNGGTNIKLDDGERIYVVGALQLEHDGGIQLLGGHHVTEILGMSTRDEYCTMVDVIQVADSLSPKGSIEVRLVSYHSVFLCYYYSFSQQIWKEVFFNDSPNLRKLKIQLNELPFYAIEQYEAAPEWAKSNIKKFTIDLEKTLTDRVKFSGCFWVFKPDGEVLIVGDPHDMIIESYNKSEEIFSFRIDFRQFKSSSHAYINASY